MLENSKKYIAEMVGTAVLVLFGCGSAVLAGSSLGVLGIAFAFGLVIVAMAYAIGPISGCHINPAVSLAMFINKRLSKEDLIGYVIAQVIGGLLGSLILFSFLSFGNLPTTQMGQNFFGNFGWLGSFVIEVVLTFVFITVIMKVTGKGGNSSLAGIVIGFTLILVHILGISLTGTSVNPARSLAPAIFAGMDALNEVWVFILAPFVGAILAAIFSKTILDSEIDK